MANAIRRLGGPAGVLAGSAWLVIWFHQQGAHGPTQVNEMNIVWGLTWMDTSRLLVIPMAFVVVGLLALYQRRISPGKLGATGSTITFGALGLLMAATLLEFWPFPWGSYELTFEAATGLAGSNPSGAIQSVGSLIFTVGVAILMTDLVKARVVPVWVALVLVAGGLTTVFLSRSSSYPGWHGCCSVSWFGAERGRSALSPRDSVPVDLRPRRQAARILLYRLTAGLYQRRMSPAAVSFVGAKLG